ncbi:MAG: methyl-accepting chemotaxis protein, partial [Chloroflexota bacterium]
VRANQLIYLLSEDEAGMAEAEQKVAEHEQALVALIDKYRQTELVQEEKDGLVKYDAAWATYKADVASVMDLKKSGKGDEAIAKITSGEGRQKVQAVEGALDSLVAVNKDIAEQGDAEGKTTAQSSQTLQIGLLAVAIIAGFGIAFWLSRMISQGVGKVGKAAERLATQDLPNLVAAVQAIAQGDLTKDVHLESQGVDVKSSDEVGAMAAAFNQMAEQFAAAGNALQEMVLGLRASVGQIAENALAVASASEQLNSAAQQAGAATQQISATIQQVAKGASEQTRSVTEAAGMVAQTNNATEQVAGSAEQVSAAVNEANDVARAGGETVGRAVTAMSQVKDSTEVVARRIAELSRHSEEIGQIVEAIDDIAEQTNLLALNAAIEAARAGEHGRGFAVVADEVRKLAERSSKATKEIAGLIQTVQQGTEEAVRAMEQGTGQVETGATLAQEAGEAIRKMLAAVERTRTQVEGISAAAQQMSAQSQAVVRSIESISSISEENAAASEEVSASSEEMSAQVEEVAATAQSMSDMAAQLQEVVARFKLDGNQREGAAVIQKRRATDWQKPQGASQRQASLSGA